MKLRYAVVALLAGALLAAAPLHAQVAPDGRWWSFDTPRFRVHFHEAALEPAARRAAGHAERAYDALSAAFVPPPRGRIDLVVADNADLANGFAIGLPTNRIVVYAHPPVDQPTLAHFHDWLELVVIHELAHLFHLDQAGGVWRVLRRAFGRSGSLFPQHHSPNWLIEGIAVYFESSLTGAGRLRDSHQEMVLRTAVLEDAFFPIDRATGDPVSWPGGSTRYSYGALFVGHLAERHGEAALGRFVRELGGQLVPYRLEAAARRAFGVGFTAAWAAWEAELRDRYGALADRLRAEGLSGPEPVSQTAGFVSHPRFGPDGRIAYSAYTLRDEPAIRVVEPDGASRSLTARSSLGPVAWVPGTGALLTAELEPRGPFRLFSELVRIDADGRRSRLTREARLREPDPHPDGRRVLGVGYAPGTNTLSVLDLETGETRLLAEPSPDVHWAGPRWSPDGSRIAVARWRRGGWFDVVVLDTTGRVVREVTSSRAIDRDPAWAPDGRTLLFSSDRTGIANLYAYDLERDELFQVTNVLSGAVQPDVSADGAWIAFAHYGADGYRVARIPWSPTAWRPVSAVARAAAHMGSRTATVAGTPGSSEGIAAANGSRRSAGGTGAEGSEGVATAGGPVRRYRPGPGLLPAGWAVDLEHGTALGAGIGAAMHGRDAVGRHAWALDGRAYVRDGRGEARLNYLFRGLGRPVVELDAAQEWAVLVEGWPVVDERGDTLRSDLFRRERRAAVLLRHSWPGWRSTRWIGAGPDARRIHGEWGDARFEPRIPIADPPLDLGLRLFGGYSSVRGFGYSISPEQGVLVQASAEARRFVRPPPDRDDAIGYQRLLTQAHAYRPIAAPGFARHVAALRLASGLERGAAGPGFGVGGISGSDVSIVAGLGINGTVRTFGVRGYPVGAQRGDRALAGTAEYRFPLLLVERGFRTWPVFLDRVWGDVFLDGGTAWCTGHCEARFAAARPEPAPLAAAGAELVSTATLGYDLRLTLRGGVAIPLRPIPTAAEPLARPRRSFYLVGGRSF